MLSVWLLHQYGIAIARFNQRRIDFRSLEAIQPDIVKLAPALLGSTRPLQRVIDRLRGIGARVMIEGVETAAMRKGAAASGIDLIQSIGILERLRTGTPQTDPLATSTETSVLPTVPSASWAMATRG